MKYINADSIALGLSPFKLEEMAFAAGRLMLERIHQLADDKLDFAFETTGASKTFAPFLLKCKGKGYKISLLYLWLKTPDLALERVAARVKDGGHNVPERIVRRRYRKGLFNFFNFYSVISDDWFLYDNSGISPVKIAEKKGENGIIIYNQIMWNKCREVVK